MKTLVVLTGPTGVGKTELSLRIAESLGSPILNCDSRQLFKELVIGTATPSQEQLNRVKHFFIGYKSIQEKYSAAKFEMDALALLERLFEQHDSILMTGGSMMYIDAVCNGIDEMPDIHPDVRTQIQAEYLKSGLQPILEELEKLDPSYFAEVDQQNHKRVIHGLEVCRQTGLPFSSFRKQTAKKRPFAIRKICLNRDRTDLYQRIDERVLQMMEDGLELEARGLQEFKHLNALNTVGYKEMFDYFEGKTTLSEAVARIQFNTHKYARKQLTWFRRDSTYQWFHPDQMQEILDYLIL